eukprot:TRINITY_DN7944_c0_g1_i2.p1 TRINITY_DN7944_c0_g1~~TRINITY_DN7944_c0_g1_i2.p1  ORF type:complete len:229 (-),score=50.66 TRINITY_DN7944_c0_g1_i2:111-797(-)
MAMIEADSLYNFQKNTEFGRGISDRTDLPEDDNFAFVVEDESDDEADDEAPAELKRTWNVLPTDPACQEIFEGLADIRPILPSYGVTPNDPEIQEFVKQGVANILPSYGVTPDDPEIQEFVKQGVANILPSYGVTPDDPEIQEFVQQAVAQVLAMMPKRSWEVTPNSPEIEEFVKEKLDSRVTSLGTATGEKDLFGLSTPSHKVYNIVLDEELQQIAQRVMRRFEDED